jgi:hypothetical protein
MNKMRSFLCRTFTCVFHVCAKHALVLLLIPAGLHAAPPFPEFVDPNPNPGNLFGATVVALSTGNVVITAPFDDAGGSDAGAVYLFNGATGALISTLTGSTANDQVGSSGVTALSNGNYLVRSEFWDNGGATDAGAVTWGSGTTGISGVVSASNSLVGSTANDVVGGRGVTALNNGNYVVPSPNWDNGGAADAGAVTWGSGTTGISGVVSASNSLVGSTTGDMVGLGFGTILSNGNYVVCSELWNNGAATDAGAVTWGSGTAGVSGVVSASNSLVGSKTGDEVGKFGVKALSNGNYVVRSCYWKNGSATRAGAVTWGSGTTGISGVVSASNSLVGSTANDVVGGSGVTELSNGHYVVESPSWTNGAATDAGAVTWGSGTSGISGVVSASNSLVGSTADDYIGTRGVTPLSNGNYVVSSPSWSNGAVTDVGAVTWGSGTTGTSGVVSASNSLVGSTANDRVGWFGVAELSNGNYVVRSLFWNNGAATRAGAVTWRSGTSSISGVVSAGNSLVGSTADDRVGSSMAVLSNGNYVVSSPSWNNGTATRAGAVTWGNGTTGISGAVSAGNSLVGSSADDRVGASGVWALSNGNYVVLSPFWNNGAATEAGAVSWGSGSSGISGVVSAGNSLVGSKTGDNVGYSGVTALSNGHYVVSSRNWDNGGATDAGAVTWGSGDIGIIGAVSTSNSLVGSKTGDNVGEFGVTAFSNGNYVVPNPRWDNGAVADAGAATWGNGATGISGAVSPTNSLVGLTANTVLLSAFADVVEDDVNNTYLVRFLYEGGGKVRVGSQVDGSSPNFPFRNADLRVTTAHAPINLATATGATPPGGVFSGLGVRGGVFFDPRNLAPAVYLLTYTVQSDSGALISATFTVTVVASPARLTVQRPIPFAPAEVGSTGRTQILRITNGGGEPVTGLRVLLKGPNRVDFMVTQPSVKTLDPGASTTFRAIFNPKTAGRRRATVIVIGSVPAVSVTLSGNGESDIGSPGSPRFPIHQ